MSAAALDPTSARLAYVRSDEAPGEGNLYLAEADGSAARALTRGKERFQALAWSPDGRWLVYSKTIDWNEDGFLLAGSRDRTDLYACDPVTGEEICLTGSDGYSRPSFDREGRLWFVSDHDGAGAWGPRVWRTTMAEALAAARSIGPCPRAITRADCEALTGELVRALPPRPWDDAEGLDAGTVRTASGVVAAFCSERLARDVGPTPEGLHAFGELVAAAYELGWSRTPFVFGTACHYGVLLEATAQARWSPGGGPLEWHDAIDPAESPHAIAINPFAALLAYLTSEAGLALDSGAVRSQTGGRPILLVATEAEGRRAALAEGGERAAEAERLRAAGDLAGAARALLGLVEEHPENRALRHAAGALLVEAGAAEDYARVLRRSAAADPEDVRTRRNLGILLVESEPAEAVRHLKEAIRLEPWHGSTYWHLAQAHLAAGDEPLAELCLQKAAEMFGPHRARAQRLLDGLRSR